MSKLFEEDEETSLEVVEDFEDTVTSELPSNSLDARRRLENMLEELRLKDELRDDFEDY